MDAIPHTCFAPLIISPKLQGGYVPVAMYGVGCMPNSCMNATALGLLLALKGCAPYYQIHTKEGQAYVINYGHPDQTDADQTLAALLHAQYRFVRIYIHELKWVAENQYQLASSRAVSSPRYHVAGTTHRVHLGHVGNSQYVVLDNINMAGQVWLGTSLLELANLVDPNYNLLVTRYMPMVQTLMHLKSNLHNIRFD
jgi:hypothetical protein